MLTKTYSLRTMFVAVTACVAFIVVMQYVDNVENENRWKSGLRNSEIISGSVEPFYNDDLDKPHFLKKELAIKFVRLAEQCPLREFDECPTTYLSSYGFDQVAVELTLTKDREMCVLLIGDCLRMEDCLVDISEMRGRITDVLSRSK